MLSKFAKPNENNLQLTYHDYANNTIHFKKYTVPDLKTIARSHKLAVSGTKPILIERLETFFRTSYYAVIIQKNARRYFVKRSFTLRGDASKNRTICVNDTDFYTMEPLENIAMMAFFSYKDNNGYVYGFNILSLLKWLKQKPGFINPYNREKINDETKHNLIDLCRLIHIMKSDYIDKDTISVIYPYYIPPNARVYRIRRRPAIVNRMLPDTITSIVENVVIQTNSMITDTSGTMIPENIIQNLSNDMNSYGLRNIEHIREVANKIRIIQSKPIHTRINEIFMEIDSLGNYTQSLWFSNLEIVEYIMFYRNLYSIWNFQGIPNHVKRLIAPLRELFIGVSPFPRNIREITKEYAQDICLKIMEELVYTGMDEEHRKLGALHTLRALTVVSFQARQSLPWLYESMN